MNARVAGLVEAAIVAALLIVPAVAAKPPVATPVVTSVTAPPGASVDGAKIASADSDPGEWLSHGRTYSEQRFSPLTAINTANVKNLGVAWAYRTYSVRGLEATPIVSDGVMFITLPWSKVIALDAATGKEIWQYDPKVPGATGRYACCDVVNRGVALWKGAVFVGTLDGRLIKLDTRTGKVLWSIDTVENHAHTYTITGAPRVMDGLVMIGNGGAEYDSRGYVSAFDAGTGKLVWRFHVVPGDPSKPQENAALTAALKTWDTTGKYKFWDIGGGGAPWNSMAYDPKLDLLYFGTGNGNPWNRNLRSPKGGDNLYLSSVVALHARTGAFAWAYQTTPGDTWDFDSTADVVLADLTIDGKLRHVLMHAPKNGFFYVIDRETGKLISAQKFATVTWAKSIDPKTGKPIENPGARYTKQMAVVYPAETGAHNWQPMSFDPQTGLVYIPAMDGAGIFVGEKTLDYKHGSWNLGVDFAAVSDVVLKLIKSGKPPAASVGYIKAWDPVAQKEVWQVAMGGAWNSGLLTTGGGLLFGGDAYGDFSAYDARTGAKLWSIDLKTGILAPAMTYSIGGVQYVALLAGWGGAGGLSAFKDPATALSKYQTDQGRLFVFKLGGAKAVAALSPEGTPPTEPPPQTANAATIARGFTLYHRNCLVCHGFYAQSEGEVPDLRLVDSGVWNQFDDIVRGGILQGGGMASFKDVLSRDDVAAIKAYILQQSHLAWDQGHPLPGVKPAH
ncbi:MAG TPA: PQQ-dependent dehydrogenase, methanol/ethanol family [Rhizomicrobium sp.]|jgi:PQQ-dependent dehydrogenase (methanol/ethanol family)|nr:PQQ-dependent dehydrogenase, methanol/ethanol family [Rhizomicrobium sp.]